MEDSSNSNIGCNGENVLVNPNQKQMLLKSELQPLSTDLPPGLDADNSFVAFMNEGYESSLSSWDSEPETDIPSLINCHGIPEENYLDMEEQNQFVGVENSDDGLLWEMDNRSYDDLLKKFMEKEDELRFSNFRLQLLEQENINLKVLVENGEVQLDNVIKESKLKDEELHKQKELSEYEIFKLNIQIEESENQLENVHEELNWIEEELQKQIAKFDHKIANLGEQLEVALENLKISKDETAILRMELESKSSETNLLQDQLKVTEKNRVKSKLELISERKQNQMLGDMVKMYEANETNQEQEVRKLKSEMLDSQAKFTLEKDELHFDIANLSKIKTELTSKLEDCESRNKELENKLRQYEAEKLKQEELHAAKQKFLQDEIISLVEDHEPRMEMVMIELEKANNMIDYLETEICSRDDKISNMKKYTDDVKTSLKELMVEYNTALNEVNNLTLRVGELENEVTRQNGVISYMADEKKEAIRQLHKVSVSDLFDRILQN